MSGSGGRAAAGDRRAPSRSVLERVAAEVARKHDLRLVVLFGSAARAGSAARPASADPPGDLDLAVLAAEPLDPVALTNAFIRSLGVQDVDLVDLSRADPLLMELAARDGIPLFEAEPGAFARFASLAARRYADTRKFREMEKKEIREWLETGGGGL